MDRTLILSVEELAIVANGLHELKMNWKDSNAFPEEEKQKVVARIAAVEASIKRQTGF